MRNILLIISLLIGLSSFAQDDFFWSYSHQATAFDTIKVTTAPFEILYLGGIYYTYSGDSLIVKTPRGSIKIPSNAEASQYSQYIYNGEIGYIISKHNDLYWIYNAGGTIINDLSQLKRLKIFGNDTYSAYTIKYNSFISSKALEEIYLQQTDFIYEVGQNLDLSNNNLLRNIRIVSTTINSISLPTSPDLSDVFIHENQLLSSITFGDLSPTIWRFYGYNSHFDQTNIDKILKYFVDSNRNPFALGTYGTDYINLCGSRNGYPSSTGYGYVSTLTSRGWYICVNNNTTTPIVSTDDATMVSSTSATLGGNASSDGGAAITARGVAYGTSANPTISGSHTTLGTGVGLFSSNVTGLSSNTIYHMRAYATNSNGTSYGADKTFTTTSAIQTVPELITTAPTAISDSTAMSGGTITFDGNYEIVAKGVCWSTSPNPSSSGLHTTDGTGTSAFTSIITGLSPNTTYYLRAYAQNRRDYGGGYSYATGYGQEEIFTTASSGECNLPTVTTNPVNSITTNSATGGGNVTASGGCEPTVKGVCWSTAMNPTTANSHTTDGSGTGSFSSSITGLNCGSTYYVRAYATNSSGTAYGNQVSFTTTSNATATITGFSSVTSTSFTANCDVTSSCSNITSRGIIYALSPGVTFPSNSQICGSGTGTYNCTPYTTLSPSTTYYVKSYAIVNGSAIYLSLESTVTTLAIPPFDPCTLSVGDSYGGGIVAYIFQSGDPGYVSGECHGIIAATSDQSSGIQWYNGSYVNVSGLSSELNSGSSNTDMILYVQGYNYVDYAAGLARSYTGGGFSDWCLPSLNDLIKLYNNKSVIGGFSSSRYWASGQRFASAIATMVDFSNGDYSNDWNKAYLYHVRAIRYF